MTAAWISPDAVKHWLTGLDGVRLPAGAAAVNAETLTRCIGSVYHHAGRYRSDLFDVDGTPRDPAGTVPADVVQAGIMWAARTVRRRNSISGSEPYGDSALYVGQYDPEIDRVFRIGRFIAPQVG